VRALVIVGPGSMVESQLLSTALKVEVKANSYPAEEGVAIFDCGKEPNYDWPDYTIVVGQCETGRHHFDLQIPKGEDATSKIIQTLSVLEDSDVDTGGSESTDSND